MLFMMKNNLLIRKIMTARESALGLALKPDIIDCLVYKIHNKGIVRRIQYLIILLRFESIVFLCKKPKTI